MAALRKTATGYKVMLESEHVVGRVTAPRCSLTLSEPYVSGVHAMLRWNGHEWELKDLSSRNGTFVDGRRISPSVVERVHKGSRIAFGRVEQEWELVDEQAPAVMAVPLDGGEPVLLEGELLPLPSSSDPSSTIYRTAAGSWILEHPDGSTVPAMHAQTFEAAGRLWRFCCFEMSPATIGAPGVAMDAVPDIHDVHLTFSVSRDEEYVHLRMAHGTGAIDLGERCHNYLLLTLARQRRKDEEAGLPDTSCGWIDLEILSRDPSVQGPQLNLSVFRIRDQFSRVNILNAGKIIERRSNPRQLRLGTKRFSIVTL